jgi:hypothetical protein
LHHDLQHGALRLLELKDKCNHHKGIKSI